CRPAVARGQQIKLLILLDSWGRQSPACLRCQPASRPELSVPGGAGIGDAGAAEDSGAVDAPDVDLAAGVLKQDVGEAVVVVVAGALDVPARPRIAEAGGADNTGAVQLPNRGFASVVLPQDIGPRPSWLKSPTETICQLGPGL